MTETLKMQLSGLSCGSCVGRAEKAIRSVAGVSDVAVNLASESATVSFSRPANTAQISQALSTAGYPAEVAQTVLEVADMTCASCVGRVEAALLAADGVTDVTVNLASETASVSFLKGATTPNALAAVATKAGYPAKPRSKTSANLLRL